MIEWIFIRHGESTANAQSVFSGQTDVDLTPTGWVQAQTAGRSLRKLLGGGSLSALWSSDLRRAYQTAVGVREGGAFTVPIQTHPALREQHLGEWEGRRIAAIERDHPDRSLMAWEYRAPGGESLAEVARRGVKLLRAIRPDGPACIVGHGGLIRALIGLLDDIPTASIGSVEIPNAVPIVRRIARERWDRIARDRLG